MTTCVSAVTHGDARSTTTPPNGKSAWSKSGRKSPAPCVPSPAPNTSATYGPTSPPPPNTASISSRHSSNSHPAGRGYPTSTDLISYRSGNAGSARGAASQITEAITTARSCGASGQIVVRADSAFYTKTVITTCRRRDVRFSVTTRIDAKIRAACDNIADSEWIDIQYPQAVYDEDTGRWIS